MNKFRKLKDIIKNVILNIIYVLIKVIKNIGRVIKQMPTKIKIFLAIILIVIIAIISISIFKTSEEKKQKYEIYDGTNLDEEKYPGYKELIDNLKEAHPNWNFTLFYTRLDWNEVISNEGHSDFRVNPLNLIPDYYEYPEDWICQVCGNKRYDNGSWLCASDEAIRQQMNPKNILNEDNIFQFLELKYTEGAHTSRRNKITY